MPFILRMASNKHVIYRPRFSALLFRTVGLRQEVQHSHHAQIPIQNSQSHNKCTPVCNKWYSTYILQQPLRKWRHPWKTQ